MSTGLGSSESALLLLTHLVCADQQLHKRESAFLQELADRIGMDGTHIQEMEKILSRDEEQRSLEEVLQAIDCRDREEVFRQAVAVAHVDGYCTTLEREVLNQIAAHWDLSQDKVDVLCTEADLGDLSGVQYGSDEEVKLSFTARILRGCDSFLSKSLVDVLVKLGPASLDNQVRVLRKKILLAGPEYDLAISKCAAIAKDDFRVTNTQLNGLSESLRYLAGGLEEAISQAKAIGAKGTAKAAAEAACQLAESKRDLDLEIEKNLQNLRQTLHAKERSLQYFTIAFMGKTKVGKSTLHAVITGEGQEAIGIGRQRTTRNNRVYEWKNIRIIDTPGIGAPGGKSDEEIAASIVDEADIICYIVTNDSQQEAEFYFLKQLKEKAKPLIILLNVKDNLQDKRRLRRFLENPEKVFKLEGPSGLGGHINRIRRYAQNAYANDYFDIVPVQLYAALLAQQESDHEKLFTASRLGHFLDSLRISVIEDGPMRRSQTLLGCTVGNIKPVHQWLQQQAKSFEDLAANLQNSHKKLMGQVQEAAQTARKDMSGKIKACFQGLQRKVPAFAEENWDADKEELTCNWEDLLKKSRFEAGLENAVETSYADFRHRVQEALEEVGREIQLITRLSAGDLDLEGVESGISTFPARNIMLFGGGILALAGIFAGGPVGWVVGGVGIVFSLLSGLFKSKEEKIREAALKIGDSLYEQLAKQERKIKANNIKNFIEQLHQLIESLDAYFDSLISVHRAISRQCAITDEKFQAAAKQLNRAYAKRVVDWLTDNNHGSLSEEEIGRTICEVERDFGRCLKIKTPNRLKLKRTESDIKRVLQEDIILNS